MDNISLGQIFGIGLALSGLFSFVCAIEPIGKTLVPSIYKMEDKKRTTYRLFYGLSGVLAAGFGALLLMNPGLIGN